MREKTKVPAQQFNYRRGQLGTKIIEPANLKSIKTLANIDTAKTFNAEISSTFNQLQKATPVEEFPLHFLTGLKLPLFSLRVQKQTRIFEIEFNNIINY